MIRDQPMTTTTSFAITATTVESSPKENTIPTFPELIPDSSGNTVTGVAITIAVTISFVIVFTISVFCGYGVLKAKRHQQQYNSNIYSQPNRSYNVRPVVHPPLNGSGTLNINMPGFQVNANQAYPDVIDEETDHTYEEIDSQHGGDTYDYADDTEAGEGHEVQLYSSTLDEEGYMNV